MIRHKVNLQSPECPRERSKFASHTGKYGHIQYVFYNLETMNQIVCIAIMFEQNALRTAELLSSFL